MLQQQVDNKADSRQIVATSKLGINIDIEGIVTIIYIRQLYKLVDFIQQTDRGGRRNGEIIDSVIVTDGLPIYYDEFDSDINQQNRKAAEGFVNVEECRRVVLNRFIKDDSRTYNELATELYDIYMGIKGSSTGCILDSGSQETTCSDNDDCFPSRSSDSAAILVDTRLTDHYKKESKSLIVLYKWLNTVYTAGCSVCYVKQ